MPTASRGPAPSAHDALRDALAQLKQAPSSSGLGAIRRRLSAKSAPTPAATKAAFETALNALAAIHPRDPAFLQGHTALRSFLGTKPVEAGPLRDTLINRIGKRLGEMTQTAITPMTGQSTANFDKIRSALDEVNVLLRLGPAEIRPFAADVRSQLIGAHNAFGFLRSASQPQPAPHVAPAAPRSPGAATGVQTRRKPVRTTPHVGSMRRAPAVAQQAAPALVDNETPVSPISTRAPTPFGNPTAYSEADHAAADRASSMAGALLAEIEYYPNAPLSRAAWTTAGAMNPHTPMQSENDLREFVSHALAVALDRNDANPTDLLRLETALEARAAHPAAEPPRTSGVPQDFDIPMISYQEMALMEIDALDNRDMTPKHRLDVAVTQLTESLQRLQKQEKGITDEQDAIEKTTTFIVSFAHGEGASRDIKSVRKAIVKLQRDETIAEEKAKALRQLLMQASPDVESLLGAP